MVLALAVGCAGFVNTYSAPRATMPAVAVSRGPATFSMQVKGLGSNADQRPIEMIHADADAAFKMLDVDNEGSIDNEKLRKYLYTRDYSPELVDKVFAGIDVDKGGDIDADVMPACGKRRTPWRPATHGPRWQQPAHGASVSLGPELSHAPRRSASAAQAPVAACGAAVRLRLASLSSRAVAAPYTGLSHAYRGSSRAAPRHAGAAHGLRQIPDAVQGEPPPLGPSRTIPPRPATRLAQPHALPLLPTYCLPLTTDCFLTGLRGQVAIRVGGHGRRHE